MKKSPQIKHILLFCIAFILPVVLFQFHVADNWYDAPVLCVPLLWLTIGVDAVACGCFNSFFIRIFTKQFSREAIETATGVMLLLLIVIPGLLSVLNPANCSYCATMNFLVLLLWFAPPLIAVTLFFLIRWRRKISSRKIMLCAESI